MEDLPDERRQRAAMVAEIAEEVALTQQWLGKTCLDPRVMAAIGRVPRHAFVGAELRDLAYLNRPLPIGQGQTISQPYIVAVMSDLAAIGPGDKVLEIGTGCGYQTAVLAELGARVHSIEVIETLSQLAGQRLTKLGYQTVTLHIGDGFLGYPGAAPYAAIVVTAAAPGEPPPALVDQLAPGGRLVIPIAESSSERPLRIFGQPRQRLTLVTKGLNGSISSRAVIPVAFVPMVKGKSA